MISEELKNAVAEYIVKNFDEIREDLLDSAELDTMEDDCGHEYLAITNYYAEVRARAEILAEEMNEDLPKIQALTDREFEVLTDYIRRKITKIFPEEELEHVAIENYQEYLEDAKERRLAAQGIY